MHTLSESDVESDSDCDSLPDQYAVIRAGGGDCVVKDVWSEHPMQEMNEPAPLPKPLAKPPEKGIPTPPKDNSPAGKTNSSEEDRYLRKPGGKSKREIKLVHCKLQVSFGRQANTSRCETSCTQRT